MEQIRGGYFSEKNDLWPGQFFSLEVEKVLHTEKSEYQDILIVQTTHHGKALILDGLIQCTEHDEFAYQEMISFLPLCAHENPAKVLIVGGGDGGVAREVSKHPLVQSVVQVEIDARVIEASKRYLPSMSVGFSSPKLTLNVCDGFEYMRNHKGEFDVIITDSSDPIGPAVNLFTKSYFKLLKEALKPDGIVCSQGSSLWLSLEHVKGTMQNCRQHFDTVKFGVANVPSYPTGQIGFVIGALGENRPLESPTLTFTDEEIARMKLRYYNGDVHRAAFVLPTFARNALYK
ncbi:hypothetical protein PPYR_03051 [Photinus pyralis]|uniref:Spermidine synthase n=1 Tax=Photinus pyralis TaxID=7054 RepID=A0A5N4A1S8_PHOPY|nr:spermidine synthase [Photinus pyralis]KAB0791251.1 hypothetical protein PPYR_03051 [Photinus pyralis]